MNRILWFAICIITMTSSSLKAITITAGKASELRPDIALKLVEIVDSINHFDAVVTKYKLYEYLDKHAKDSLIQFHSFYEYASRPYSDHIFIVLNSLPENAKWAFNGNTSIKNEFFTILFLNRNSISNRIYNDFLWPNNHLVRQYGYQEIMGYQIILVDLKKGSSYFKLSNQLDEKQYVLQYYPPAPPTGEYIGHIEDYFKFIYKVVDNKLIPIYERWPDLMYGGLQNYFRIMNELNN